MKIEPRGKYPGIKVHLNVEEVQAIIDAYDGLVTSYTALLVVNEMAKRLRQTVKEDPGILTDRTPDQIAAALEKEEVTARAKKNALLSGYDWKKIKTTIEVKP